MLTDNEILEIAQEAADKAWTKFVRLYPKLRFPGYTMPRIILNNRLKTTAGRCDYTTRIVDLSPSLMRENVKEFCEVTIPHELAHMVAYDVYGDTGHGSAWKSVMVTFGLPPDRCHSMTSSVSRAMAEKRQNRVITKSTAEFVVGDRVTFVHRNRQRVETNIVGTVTKINLKTIKVKRDPCQNDIIGLEWTVPKVNTCNLRHV